MQTKSSSFNNDELQMDTTLEGNPNRKILAFAEEAPRSANRVAGQNATPNFKTSFIVKNGPVSDNMEYAGMPTPLGHTEFAYPGTDKGVAGQINPGNGNM